MCATSVEAIVFLVIFCAANELNYRSKPVPPSYGDAGIVFEDGWQRPSGLFGEPGKRA